ncbi:carboxymuconolactone decarboxylase family protein [Brevibacillus sp. DP1.3A]|uniref:carboxymuconolactone decarboxylase family protein n=1 Tax=Brevibacillus sp. DP1.3A TaxID=2738867 RepID=UPI00156AA8EB|nr:carboxymuconolactone decarboxylase family protein [Brevibacillus sp. DP1.3A]UED72222.1 carboxymuconolactone decarboxylase family protein [Brevibacillus sp. DP1.3A]
MQSRMKNPVIILPEVGQSLQALGKALFTSAEKNGVPARTLFLAYLRISQINGDSVCVTLHSNNAKNAGESTERILAVAAWRDTSNFTDAERAVLALSESMTRLNEQSQPVPDEVYEEAARHYDEAALATLIAGIATANLYNRINVSTRQVADVLAKK